MKIRSTVLALGIAATLTGCQNMDSNGLLSSGAEAFQAYSLSDAQVKTLSDQACKEMDAKAKIAPANSEYSQRLNKIAAALGDNINGQPVNYKVYETKDVNAFAMANGCEFDHGTMFYTAPNEGLIDPNHSVQIGIRTEFDKDNGFTVLDAGQVNDRSVDDVIAQVKQIVGDMPVYLTFDIDCLDPAFAPGTGTPVIGGLTSDRAIKLVRGLKDLNIVGMDVVEVAPAYDQSEITALAAATLALEMLYIQAAKKGE